MSLCFFFIVQSQKQKKWENFIEIKSTANRVKKMSAELQQYVDMQKPCPKCGKPAIPILLGLPGDILMKLQTLRLVHLDGCMSLSDDATHFCNKCNYRFKQTSDHFKPFSVANEMKNVPMLPYETCHLNGKLLLYRSCNKCMKIITHYPFFRCLCCPDTDLCISCETSGPFHRDHLLTYVRSLTDVLNTDKCRMWISSHFTVQKKS